MKVKMMTLRNLKMKNLRTLHNLPHAIPAWGITAAKYCPSAGDCKSSFSGTSVRCFGLKGAYLFPVVRKKYEWRANLSFTNEFVEAMALEISRYKSKYIRIHDIGDFYNEVYLWKWISIMKSNPDKTFWCYTKEVKLFKESEDMGIMPDNFKYIFSYGGKQDHLIDKDKDRFSVCIPKNDLDDYQGYTNLSEDELKITDNSLRKFYTIAH